MSDDSRSYRTMGEIGKEALEEAQSLAAQCFVEEEFIVFKIYKDEDDSPTYEVPLSECDTLAKIIGWQFHLGEKQWITSDLLLCFTHLACTHHNLSISH